MKYTSSEAAKLIRTLNEEQDAIKSLENKTWAFVAALEEDPESVRPDYSYEETQIKLKELESKIRKVKHAINVFNVTTEVPGFGMTIDQMLVYLPQLSEKKSKLAGMAKKLPKERLSSSSYGGKAIIEYQYANYSIEQAKADLAAVTDELARAQTALDVLNNSVTMEIDVRA